MIIMEKKQSNIIASIKDVDGKKGIVTGYFAAFDNVDSDGDVIRKGAFAKTISENFKRIKHLKNHNPSEPLGVLEVLNEDTKGLYYESRIGTHDLGIDFVKMVESGLITEHSIGFRTIKRNQLQDYEGYKKSPENGWYELTEIKLWEGSSLTAWGANENTPLTGLKDLKDAHHRIQLLAKAVANGNFTDETFRLLELELQALKTATVAAEQALQPTVTEASKATDIQLINELKKINQLWK